LVNGKPLLRKEKEDAFQNPVEFPPLTYGMLRFTKSAREGEWSRLPVASSSENAVPLKLRPLP
jgi:hypothetical protein